MGGYQLHYMWDRTFCCWLKKKVYRKVHNILVFAGQRDKRIYVNIRLHLIEFFQKEQKKLITVVFFQEIPWETSVDGRCFTVFFVGFLVSFKQCELLPNHIQLHFYIKKLVFRHSLSIYFAYAQH